MQDDINDSQPETRSLCDLPWSVGQTWVREDRAQAVHALLPDSYKHSVITGRPFEDKVTRHLGGGNWTEEVERVEMIKHVLIMALTPTENGDADECAGVVADLTAVISPVKFLSRTARSPRWDADLAEYICRLHNDELARKQAGE